LLLLTLQIQLVKGAFKCETNTWTLVGKYCYLIQDTPIGLSTTFDARQDYCKNKGSDLPCPETYREQFDLLNAVADKRGTYFDPFFIGLICNTSALHWAWIADYVTFAAGVGTFDDDQF
ncbi:hypothetical protein PFISCL1PPCAC_18153, partial [Pristionchus fissidentatus]